MRMTEFNRQLDDLESMINRLEPSSLQGAWLLFPVAFNPLPSDATVKGWLIDIGLPDTVQLRSRPARHDVKAPLLDVQDDISQIFEGWELVKAPVSKVVSDSGYQLAWVHHQLTGHYQNWLKTRELTRH